MASSDGVNEINFVSLRHVTSMAMSISLKLPFIFIFEKQVKILFEPSPSSSIINANMIFQLFPE